MIVVVVAFILGFLGAIHYAAHGVGGPWLPLACGLLMGFPYFYLRTRREP